MVFEDKTFPVFGGADGMPFSATVDGSWCTRKAFIHPEVPPFDEQLCSLFWEDGWKLSAAMVRVDVSGEKVVILFRQHLELHLKVSYKESMNEGKGQTSPADVPNPKEGFWD
tara:strand:- start:1839 stop:2174 length:336 start_codon:yes stop_codon:yes gene_type:complete